MILYIYMYMYVQSLQTNDLLCYVTCTGISNVWLEALLAAIPVIPKDILKHRVHTMYLHVHVHVHMLPIHVHVHVWRYMYMYIYIVCMQVQYMYMICNNNIIIHVHVLGAYNLMCACACTSCYNMYILVGFEFSSIKMSVISAYSSSSVFMCYYWKDCRKNGKLLVCVYSIHYMYMYMYYRYVCTVYITIQQCPDKKCVLISGVNLHYKLKVQFGTFVSVLNTGVSLFQGVLKRIVSLYMYMYVPVHVND